MASSQRLFEHLSGCSVGFSTLRGSGCVYIVNLGEHHVFHMLCVCVLNDIFTFGDIVIWGLLCMWALSQSYEECVECGLIVGCLGYSMRQL